MVKTARWARPQERLQHLYVKAVRASPQQRYGQKLGHVRKWLHSDALQRTSDLTSLTF